MLQDMLSGSIHGGFHSMAAAGEMVHARRVRPLGASGTARIPSLPDVPTMTELGFSSRFSFSGFSGLFAPLRTPPHIIERLTEVFRLAANKPETLQRLRRIDTIPGYLGPADFRAFLQKMLADWTAITNALDLRMDG